MRVRVEFNIRVYIKFDGPIDQSLSLGCECFWCPQKLGERQYVQKDYQTMMNFLD